MTWSPYQPHLRLLLLALLACANYQAPPNAVHLLSSRCRRNSILLRNHGGSGHVGLNPLINLSFSEVRIFHHTTIRSWILADLSDLNLLYSSTCHYIARLASGHYVCSGANASDISSSCVAVLNPVQQTPGQPRRRWLPLLWERRRFRLTNEQEGVP